MAARKSNQGFSTGILLLLVVLSLAGAGAWYLKGRQEKAQAAQGSIKSTLHLETFILNLADPGQRAYLRVGIDLGLGRRETGKGNDSPPVALVRDTILSVLGRLRVDQLATESDKAAVKAELLSDLRSRVPQLDVEEVYFTEFLIQK